MQLGAGTSLKQGKYLLNHGLDQQGIGWTYRATEIQTNQPVLVKTLNPVLRAHPEYRRICQDFEARSRAGTKLRHPGWVNIVDFFYEEEGTQTSTPGSPTPNTQSTPFLVMENLSGMTLSDRIRKETLSEADIISLLRQVSSTLTAAHRQNLVHGNLRPRNIMRHSGHSEYVLVGSAASLLPSLFERSARQNPYAAPELSHGKLTVSADIYSLGAILYTCLSGHSPSLAPFDAPLTDRLPLLSLLKPGAVRLLRSAMAHEITDRPESPEAWLALLASRSTASPSPVLPPVTPVLPPPINRPPTIARPEPLPRYQPDPTPVKAAHPVPPSTSPQPIAPPEPRSIPPQKHRPLIHRLPSQQSICLTIAIASLSGILFGLLLRFQAAQRPGASLFHMGQSFPQRPWKGTLNPDKSGDDFPIEVPGSGPKSSSSQSSTSQSPTSQSPTSQSSTENTNDRTPTRTPDRSFDRPPEPAIQRSVEQFVDPLLDLPIDPAPPRSTSPSTVPDRPSSPPPETPIDPTPPRSASPPATAPKSGR